MVEENENVLVISYRLEMFKDKMSELYFQLLLQVIVKLRHLNSS